MRIFLFLLVFNGCTFFCFSQQRLDGTLLKRIEVEVTDLMDEGKIPGLSMVLVDGDTMIVRSYGYADKATSTLVTSHTLFQLGSCSKAFTALAIMQLVKNHQIDLNASVSDYLPWFTVKYKDSAVRITILQLLHHTSGISWQTIAMIPESNDSNALEQTVRMISGSNLRRLPGKRYEYATINYDILALVLQKVTGQSFESYLQQHVFQRLNLGATTVGRPIDSNLLATGYKISFLRPRPYNAPVYKGNNAAGYVISNAEDIARWLKFEMGLGDREMYDLAELTQQRDETVPLHGMLSYAMGWEVSLNGNGEVSHSGTNPNYTSYIAFRKKQGLGVAILTNANSNFTDFLGNRVMKILAGEKTGREYLPGDGNDKSYTMASLVIGFYILVVIALLIYMCFAVIRKQRVFEGLSWTKLYKMARSLAVALPFLYGIYILPKAMAGFTWESILVWSPASFGCMIVVGLIALGISYVAYFGSLFFPEINKYKKAAPQMVLFSILSSLANVIVIILVTSAAESNVRLRYQVFYYVLALSIYLVGWRFVQVRLIRLTRGLIYDLRIKMIDRIFSTSYQRFESIDRGRIYTTLDNDVETMGGTLEQVIALATNTVTTIGTFLYLASIAFWTTMLTILLISVLSLVYYFATIRTAAFFEEARDSRNVFMRLVSGLIEGYKEITLHWNKKMEYRADIKETADVYRDRLVRSDIRFFDAFLVGESVIIFLLGIVVFAIPRIFLNMPYNTIISFVIVILFLTGPIGVILRAFPSVMRIRVAWRRIQQFTKEIPVNLDLEKGSSPVDKKVNSIRAEGVQFKYKKDDEQSFEVGPIDLEIKHGEILFIIGGNGSGKTTLAMLLTGLYEPDQGRLLINDKVVANSQLSEYFSTVFNPVHLFEKLYNIKLSGKSEELKKYLSLLHLSEKVEISGDKYSTIRLSGGQRKRLALLQCYLEDSPIYLFDEWAADQDPEYRNFFYNTLLPEMKRAGKIVIAITHDDHYFHIADKVLVMKQGKLEAYTDRYLSATRISTAATL